MGKAEAMASSQVRRGRIVSDLVGSKKPLSGAALAKELGVSRQIIVQDIALLRANGHDIVATNRGYVLAPSREPQVFMRRFKVHHGEEQTIDELETIVDLGGTVEDVMVNHRVYGKVTASLGLKSRRDIARFDEDMRTGRSSLLMTVTSWCQLKAKMLLTISRRLWQIKGIWRSICPTNASELVSSLGSFFLRPAQRRGNMVSMRVCQ